MILVRVVDIVPNWIKDEDREHFRTFGYMVIRDVIPRSLIENAVVDIAAFIGADLADRSTWYRSDPVLDGVVPLHHAQSLWDIREYPGLHQVFTEFHGTPRLLVDINRCIFRPPVNPNYPSLSYGSIHWDTDPRATEESLQAVILLSDTDYDEGGFQCIPKVYQNLDAWLKLYARLPSFDFIFPGLNDWTTTHVTGKAGDLILWSTKLPHGSATNLSKRPRVATFVMMGPPADYAEEGQLLQRWWQTKRAPVWWRGMPGQLDPEPGEPAVLSDLGLKLIGALPW